MTLRTETELVQIGNRREEPLRSINTPIYFSTAYRHEHTKDDTAATGYDYIRTGNPTRDVLEDAIARLENGDRGYACSSGMAAMQLVFSLFEKGAHFVASRDLYGGSYRLFELYEKNYGFSFDYWANDDYGELESLIKNDTKALFIETPTNPLMSTVDISEVVKVAKKHGILTIVDNTLYTPLLQKPLEEGADIVIHSATKYLAGHNDVLAGLVAAKGEELCEELFHLHNAIGGVLAPFDCWSTIRGMKTLALRMRQHESNAKQIKEFLESHPQVQKVFYPGKGGMLSFEVKQEEQVVPFLRAIRLFTFAESLGGVESLITYPVTQTHMDIPRETREAYGLSNTLLRVSVGIEDARDLIDDLDQALNKVGAKEVQNN
ncbi:aminotransferase class I/II-fold pyridoxal phosphate-dependent enzyme [Aciduricibacillus chroicocephali]|uniref:Aminotransferase class I/II-fold pyridoxal phosphate-dependent enzyme n=1 Tax=Aciduricibacillus chroicocephali TaxID=3054939 RepID=A0ABY9KZN5_9BACI|nr:aminotransferase class I/II-fold pyridoxal phosphate-dependent enzyme [Bacillaceae bacterium 44XB]